MSAIDVSQSCEVACGTSLDQGLWAAVGYQTLYETVMETIPSPVVFIDRDLRLADVNRNYLERTCRSRESVLGRRLSEVFPEDTVRELDLEGEIDSVFRTGSEVRGERLTYRTPELELRVNSYWLVLVRRAAAQGTCDFVMLVMEDVTEQSNLHVQVLHVQRLAALGTMFGSIAHELRGPLAVVSSACHFLQRDELNKAFIKECAEQIDSCIQRTSVIIDYVLRLAEPATNKARFEPVDLCSTVVEAVRMVENESRLGRVRAVVEMSETPVMVSGCAVLLQQVVVNLLLNAIKAMPGGGELAVALAPERNLAVLKIRDTGRGIPSTAMDRIFDPFYTTSEPGDGFGLGLSFCQNTVMEHFGMIEVESQEGIGSTFTVLLPAL